MSSCFNADQSLSYSRPTRIGYFEVVCCVSYILKIETLYHLSHYGGNKRCAHKRHFWVQSYPQNTFNSASTAYEISPLSISLWAILLRLSAVSRLSFATPCWAVCALTERVHLPLVKHPECLSDLMHAAGFKIWVICYICPGAVRQSSCLLEPQPSPLRFSRYWNLVTSRRYVTSVFGSVHFWQFFVAGVQCR